MKNNEVTKKVPTKSVHCYRICFINTFLISSIMCAQVKFLWQKAAQGTRNSVDLEEGLAQKLEVKIKCYTVPPVTKLLKHQGLKELLSLIFMKTLTVFEIRIFPFKKVLWNYKILEIKYDLINIFFKNIVKSCFKSCIPTTKTSYCWFSWYKLYKISKLSK